MLVIMVVFAVLFGGGGFALGRVTADSSTRHRKSYVNALRQGLTGERDAGRVATKALRSVANGAGNPALEAQIALDEIDKIKELP